MSGSEVDFSRDAPIRGSFPARWIHGSPSPRRPTDPPIQVHPYDPYTYILRESKDVSFEAPFLYLLLGNRRAFLLDTGATTTADRFPLRATVDGVLQRWLADHPREDYELVIAHSHGHGDHVAGDAQFAGRPNTRIVGREAESVHAFFGLSPTDERTAQFDLGGRTLGVFPIPGHHRASIAVYDPWTGFLLTGDTVCPGRLYVQDMEAFLASLERMERFAAVRPVTYLMGGHIEMTNASGRDYPVLSRYQPDERPLALTPDRLGAILAAARSARHRPGAHRFDDFAIYHGPCRRAMLSQLLRGTARNLRHRVFGG